MEGLGGPVLIVRNHYAHHKCDSLADPARNISTSVEANAVAGPSARESTAATMNRQPTPHSIAAAEAKLGEISPEKVQAFEAAIARARVADRIADPSACKKALADAQSALDQL
jgi:hypothetical protein